MRLAFWRTGDDKARVQRAASKPAPATYNSTGAGLAENLDLRTLGKGLVRNRDWIIVPTVLAALLSIAAANLVTPRYKSEAPDRWKRERFAAAKWRAQRGTHRARF
jgi:tyrosine-protein kinase Etk/Wzc